MNCIKTIAVGAAYGVATTVAACAGFAILLIAGIKTSDSFGLESGWAVFFFMVYTFALMGAAFGAIECKQKANS